MSTYLNSAEMLRVNLRSQFNEISSQARIFRTLPNDLTDIETNKKTMANIIFRIVRALIGTLFLGTGIVLNLISRSLSYINTSLSPNSTSKIVQIAAFILLLPIKITRTLLDIATLFCNALGTTIFEPIDSVQNPPIPPQLPSSPAIPPPPFNNEEIVVL